MMFFFTKRNSSIQRVNPVAFYPPVLQVSLKFSIYFHPRIYVRHTTVRAILYMAVPNTRGEVILSSLSMRYNTTGCLCPVVISVLACNSESSI